MLLAPEGGGEGKGDGKGEKKNQEEEIRKTGYSLRRLAAMPSTNYLFLMSKLGLGKLFHDNGACSACVRPWVPSPVLQQMNK